MEKERLKSKTRRLESRPRMLYLLLCKFQDFFGFTNPRPENMGRGDVEGYEAVN